MNNSTTGCKIDPEQPWKRIVKITVYAIIMVVALIGNILVCLIVRKTSKATRTALHYFLFNMALSDLVIPIVAVNRLLVELWTGSDSWLVTGLLGSFLCKFVFFISDVSPMVSILNLLFIACDRFVAIVLPFQLNLLRSWVCHEIAFSWILACAYFAPYFYAFRLVEGKCVMDWRPVFDHAKTREHYTGALCVLFILVPFALLFIMYSWITYKLRQSAKYKHNAGCGRHARRRKSTRRITILSFLIVLSFAMCWGAYFALLVTLNFAWRWDASLLPCYWGTFVFVAQFLAYSNSAVNPAIYFMLMKDFRSCLKALGYHPVKRKGPLEMERIRDQNIVLRNHQRRHPALSRVQTTRL